MFMICPQCKTRTIRVLQNPTLPSSRKYYFWCDKCQVESGWFASSKEAFSAAASRGGLVVSRQIRRDRVKNFDVVALNRAMASRRIGSGKLAKKIGVARITVDRWRSGISEPIRRSLEQIAAALDVPIEQLIG